MLSTPNTVINTLFRETPKRKMTLSRKAVCKGGTDNLLQGSQAGRGTAQQAELGLQEGNDSAFDPSVVAILEEAITLGILPPFRYV